MTGQLSRRKVNVSHFCVFFIEQPLEELKRLYLISTHPFISQQLTLNISRRFASSTELARRHIVVQGTANVSVTYISAAYTHNMGGVDCFDRKLASWDKVIKSKKWWFRIFLFFLHAIKISAFVLFKQIQKQRNVQCKMTLEDFIEKLIKEAICRNKFACRTRTATEASLSSASQATSMSAKHQKTKVSTFLQRLPQSQVPQCMKPGFILLIKVFYMN